MTEQTTTAPLDDTRLDEIAARAAGLYEYATGLDDAWQAEADQLAGTDAPALIAELRRQRAQIAELEAERAKYVNHEPTVAEEMAYLNRCLDAVYDVCDAAVRQATRWEHPLPVPEWVETVRTAADGAAEALTTRPALPWAHVMDDGDLHLFLDDLVSAAIDRWRSDPDVPDREILANVEKVCAGWRTPGQGHRSDDDTETEAR
jgi:hypothetical protein